MNSKSFILISLFVFCLLPILAFAAEPLVYKSLVSIPGIQANSGFGDYINALYGLSIAIAALMAVIKIIIAGVKYMLSDVVTSKQEAIGDIRGSLLGLVVVISAVLVLTIINPQLAETEIFTNPITLPEPVVGNVVNVPAVAPIHGVGYTYRPIIPTDPNFKAGCDTSNGYVYETNSFLGNKEVCYDPLPNGLTVELEAIFKPASAFNLPKIINRYQIAHRPHMITDPVKLKALAVAHDSTLKNSPDSPYGVFLAVDYLDGTNQVPAFSINWIDAANLSTFADTCHQFARATNLNVKQVIKLDYPGYLVCVSVPVP